MGFDQEVNMEELVAQVHLPGLQYTQPDIVQIGPKRRNYIDDVISRIRSRYEHDGKIDWTMLADDEKINFLVDERFFIPTAGYMNKDGSKVVCVSPWKNATDIGVDSTAYQFAHILLQHTEPQCSLEGWQRHEEARYFARELGESVSQKIGNRLRGLLAVIKHPIGARISARYDEGEVHRYTNNAIREILN